MFARWRFLENPGAWGFFVSLGSRGLCVLVCLLEVGGGEQEGWAGLVAGGGGSGR